MHHFNLTTRSPPLVIGIQPDTVGLCLQRNAAFHYPDRPRTIYLSIFFTEVISLTEDLFMIQGNKCQALEVDAFEPAPFLEVNALFSSFRL